MMMQIRTRMLKRMNSKSKIKIRKQREEVKFLEMLKNLIISSISSLVPHLV